MRIKNRVLARGAAIISTLFMIVVIAVTAASPASAAVRSKTAGCTPPLELSQSMTITYDTQGTKSAPKVTSVKNNKGKTGSINLGGTWYGIAPYTTVPVSGIYDANVTLKWSGALLGTSCSVSVNLN